MAALSPHVLEDSAGLLSVTRGSLRAPETSVRSAWRSCRTARGHPATSWKHLRSLHSRRWALRRKETVSDSRVSSPAPISSQDTTDLQRVTVGRKGDFCLRKGGWASPLGDRDSFLPHTQLLLSEPCSFCASPDTVAMLWSAMQVLTHELRALGPFSPSQLTHSLGWECPSGRHQTASMLCSYPNPSTHQLHTIVLLRHN